MEERWEAILAKLADIVRNMPPLFRDARRQHAALRYPRDPVCSVPCRTGKTRVKFLASSRGQKTS